MDAQLCEPHDGVSRAEAEGQDRVARVVPVDDDPAPAREGHELDDREGRDRGWVLRVEGARVQRGLATDGVERERGVRTWTKRKAGATGMATRARRRAHAPARTLSGRRRTNRGRGRALTHGAGGAR